MTPSSPGHETTPQSSPGSSSASRALRVTKRLLEEIDSRRRGRVPDRHDPGDAAPPAGLPNAAPRLVKQPVSRRLRLPGGRLPGPQRLPGPPRPRDLPRPVRVPARALPRRVARHLHLDPVRRRPAPLPGRELRHARDEDRAARGARAREPPPRRTDRGRPAPGDHDQPARGARDRPPLAPARPGSPAGSPAGLRTRPAPGSSFLAPPASRQSPPASVDLREGPSPFRCAGAVRSNMGLWIAGGVRVTMEPPTRVA